MQKMFALLVGAMLFAGPVESANPIRKVVKLMQEMQKEIEVQKKSEQELFEKFMCICTEYPPELRESIDEGTKMLIFLPARLRRRQPTRRSLSRN